VLIVNQVSGRVARREYKTHAGLAMVLMGLPGAGKGTQAQLLADQGWSHINVGGLIRSEVAAETAWGIHAAALMHRGDLVPSQDIQSLVARELERRTLPVVIEGYPRRIREAYTWRMADQVARVFGGSVALVEHGSSGHEHGPSGACIDHAHIHLFPLDTGIDPSLFKVPGARPVDDLAELSTLARLRKNYYYCTSNRTKGYLAVEPKLRSQQARRTWAAGVGRPYEWDWALFPFLPNAQLTATRLRQDELSFDAELNETLSAYDAAADWYASHTSTFPEKSSLRTEMDWLADHTDGAIKP
jgi:Adenylate kinase